MAHARYEQLADLEPVLETLRGWDDLVEPRPGIFYLKRTPFLHFHVKGERRWADARAGAGWAELEIPFGASATARKRFLADVKRAFAATRPSSAPARRSAPRVRR